METAVNKLEAMFQKAESDLDYIEHKLEFELVKILPQNVSSKNNPVKLLEIAKVIKSRYRDLSAEADQIAAEQRESMDFIRSQLATTLQVLHKLQEQSDLKFPPLTEEEQAAIQNILKFEVSVDAGPSESSEDACAESTKPIAADEGPEFEPISGKMFKSVPQDVRLTVKLPDLNTFYRQLFDHFKKNKDCTPLSVLKMNKLNMKVTEAKIKTLKTLEVIQLDKKGHVRLSL
ncbi:spindle and kinetochore-associated protein 2 [Callorhinchus milii]|uniref:Protein FAM33A n=1 Tax=Callorhinchus milii TaxID=7868 RepID=A0A4W3K4W6_CALMI|nr:spindle and kinetochore-associated protein 2 [Callorhinchus milii]|eukprot:gi/632975708/ref/XP_007904376.1/ PREDICTED: spindle and kinetochore-associated protein 2 [Callorhinchus milii]